MQVIDEVDENGKAKPMTEAEKKKAEREAKREEE